MPVDEEGSQTVLVLLKPASGRQITTADAVSDAVAGLAPSPRAAATVAKYFADRGCDVGPLVGVSFAVTLPAAAVERLLGEEEDGEFPQHRLPRAVARSIERIVRDRPIDFGPVSFA